MNKEKKKQLQNPCPKCYGRGVYKLYVPHYYTERDADGRPVRRTRWIEQDGRGSEWICRCAIKRTLKNPALIRGDHSIPGIVHDKKSRRLKNKQARLSRRQKRQAAHRRGARQI